VEVLKNALRWQYFAISVYMPGIFWHGKSGWFTGVSEKDFWYSKTVRSRIRPGLPYLPCPGIPVAQKYLSVSRFFWIVFSEFTPKTRVKPPARLAAF
jgi:hypothetical protein